jgi:mRNA-degrading endonuclease RelE of RelBE toxin-antitoxin system
MPQLIDWTADFKSELRKIDQKTALRILESVAKLALTGEGDVRKLKAITPPQYRLRIGEYRVLFRKAGRRLFIEDVTTRQGTDY